MFGKTGYHSNDPEVERFFCAASEGNLDEVRKMLEENPELITAHGYYWNGILHTVAYSPTPSMDVADFLISCGARSDITKDNAEGGDGVNDMGRTPIQVAVDRGHNHLAHLLNTGERPDPSIPVHKLSIYP